MRDDKWLFQKLDEIWDNHFLDIPQDNDVRIVWGRRARTRLGSIKQSQKSKLKNQNDNSKFKNLELNANFKFQISNSGTHPETIITINSLFKDENIPEYVVTATIAHELSHYAHGFHSPLEQKYQTPHAGGIVHNEMKERGLGDILKKQKKWLKANWREYVMVHLPPSRARKRKIIIKWF